MIDLTKAEQLAEDHWTYIDGILIAHQQENLRGLVRYHYVTAFVHGYKHAIKSIEESRHVFSECGGLGEK